jgi:hypothetical protein
MSRDTRKATPPLASLAILRSVRTGVKTGLRHDLPRDRLRAADRSVTVTYGGTACMMSPRLADRKALESYSGLSGRMSATPVRMRSAADDHSVR